MVKHMTAYSITPLFSAACGIDHRVVIEMIKCMALHNQSFCRVILSAATFKHLQLSVCDHQKN